MTISKKVLLTLTLVAASFLIQPILLHAFSLIEVLITVTLEPDEEYSQGFDPVEFPNTGFTIANPGQAEVFIDGESALVPIGRLPGENIQDGFALLDNTLLLQLSATDAANGRAVIRTTYRMDVSARRLGRENLRNLLFDQGVVATEGRASARARYMDLADARMMRFDESDGRWIRAIRAIRADSIDDIDFRFTPRMEPDGILGHYGNYTDVSGNAYVWAVMDRNSKYAVGFTVDRDDDGYANSDDNCVDVTNPGQNNNDTDSLGDACDSDDDNDSWLDADDNCPLVVNTDQLDTDNDGFGDACDADDDNDGVNDGIDQCVGTQVGAVVDEYGCSIEDTCPCGNEWKNHGAYVRCNARTSESFLNKGLLSELEKDVIMSLAGQSECGSRK